MPSIPPKTCTAVVTLYIYVMPISIQRTEWCESALSEVHHKRKLETGVRKAGRHFRFVPTYSTSLNVLLFNARTRNRSARFNRAHYEDILPAR